MSDNRFDSLMITICVVIVAFLAMGACTVFTHDQHINDRLHNQRATQVKVACIHSGKQWIGDQCVAVASKYSG